MTLTGVPVVITNVQVESRLRAVYMENVTRRLEYVLVNQDGEGIETALRALQGGLELTARLSSPGLLE